MVHLQGQIQDAEDVGRAIHLVEGALSAARSHFQKEEQILFPMAQRLLGDDTLPQLGRAWAQARRVTID
jgi:iron-sulfur cluster repair protein YtfE (RIC family)